MHSLFSPPNKNRDNGFDVAWDPHVPETESSYEGATDEPVGVFAIDDRDGQLYMVPCTSFAFMWSQEDTTILSPDIWDCCYTRSQDDLCANVCAESFYRLYPAPLRVTYLKSKHEGKYIFAHTCLWNTRIIDDNTIDEYTNGCAMVWLFTHATSESIFDQYKEAQDGVHNYTPVCVLPEAQTSVRPSPSEIKDVIKVDRELFMKMSLQTRSSIVKTLSTTRVLACPSNSRSMDEFDTLESLNTNEIVETDQEAYGFEDEDDGFENGDESIEESLDYEILDDVQGVVDDAMRCGGGSFSSSVDVTFSPAKLPLADFKSHSFSSLSEFVLSPRSSNQPMKSPIFFAASPLTPIRSKLSDTHSRFTRASIQPLGGVWDGLDLDSQRLVVGYIADSILADASGPSAVAQYESLALVSSTINRLLREELVSRIKMGVEQAMQIMTCYDGSNLGQLGEFVRNVYATYACSPRYLVNLSTRTFIIPEWKRMRMNHSPSVDVIKCRAMK